MEKLLVIEDTETIRIQLTWGLGQDYTLLQGSDSAQAMDQFQKFAPKVVMLDLGLPSDPEGTSEGFRCLQWMLASRPGTKVVVLTGNGDRETVRWAISCGAYDFYQKPIDLAGLKIVIRRAFHLSGIEEERVRLQEALERSGAGLEGSAGQRGAMERVAYSEVLGLAGAETVREVPPPAQSLTLREARDRVEKGMVSAAVDSSGGNMVKASELLGVSRPTLYDLLKKHGLFKPGARQ